jgi:hypothetical protein
MMEEESIFETSINIYHTTQRNIPEDSHNLFLIYSVIFFSYDLFLP